MPVIELSKGQHTIVDEEDLDIINQHSWYAHWQGNNFYAASRTGGAFLYLHRVLMEPEDGMVVDHINRNSLDNRRSNLRVVTQAENLRNRDPYGMSVFKYVYFCKYKDRWYWKTKDASQHGFASEIEALNALIQWEENCE
jgi:hypothetical protein